jgi:hypothetical protein
MRPVFRPSSSPRARKYRRRTAALNETYLRQLLSQGTDIHPSAWPAALVTLKHNTILAKRKLYARPA